MITQLSLYNIYRSSLTVVIIFRHVWWINWLKIPRFLQGSTFFSLCVRSNVRVKEMLFHVSLIYLRYCTRWFKWKVFIFLTSRSVTVFCEIHWVACYKFKILASPLSHWEIQAILVETQDYIEYTTTTLLPACGNNMILFSWAQDYIMYYILFVGTTLYAYWENFRLFSRPIV